MLPPLLSALLSALLAVTVLWKGGKTLESTWVLTGTVWCVLLLMLFLDAKQRTRRVHTSVVLLSAAFLSWSLLSLYFSQTPNYGLDELLRDASCIALFLPLSTLLQEEKLRAYVQRRLLHAVAAVTLAAVAVGIAVYALQPVSRFVGTFYDFRFDTDYWPNAWAQYLLLAWPLFLLWAQPWKKQLWWARMLVCGVVLGALLLSYSRGATVAFAGQAVLLPATLLFIHRNTLKGRDLGNAVIVCVSALAVALLTFSAANVLRSRFHSVESVTAKVTFTADEGTSSIDERSQFWSQARQLASERPLWGWGPYAFRFVQPRLQQGVLATSDHPHNMWLKLAMERGIVAAVLLGALLLCVFVFALRSLVRGTASPALPFTLTSAAGVLAHNLIDFNLQFVGIVFPLWVVLALVASERRPPARGARFILVLLFSFAVSSLALTVTAREAPLLFHSSIGRRAEVSKDYTAALAAYELAEGQWLPRDLQLSKVSVFIALHRLSEAKRELDAYRLLNPVDPRAFTVAGFLHLSAKKPQEALGEFSQAFIRNGYNDASILRGLLLTLDALGRPVLDREWEDAIVRRLEEFTDAVAFNTHFIALSRNVEELEQAMNIAAAVYPHRKTELRALLARLQREAAEERSRLSAKQGGLLW